MSTFRVEKYRIDLRLVGEPFAAFAKRYTSLQDSHSSQGNEVDASLTPSGDEYVLIFAHALACHKETWEPVIARLFELHSDNSANPVIAEIWTVDSPDHGESATLNQNIPRTALRMGRVSCRSFGGAIISIIRSGFLRHSPRRKLVLIGHSAGSIGAVLSTMYPSHPQDIPFSSIVLVEPWMIHSDLLAASAELRAALEATSRSGLRRRDSWASRAEALEYLKAKGVWKTWDARVLELYIQYGLAPTKDDGSSSGTVALAYPRQLEGEAYADVGEGQEALKQLSQLCSRVPVHVIFGEDNLKVAAVKAVQERLCAREEGRCMASVTILPRTGHMAPQQSPEFVADAIYRILVNDALASRTPREKL